jgi:SlyX protein
MSETLDRIEIKIAYLERANAELSDVVYRQSKEIEALHARLSELIERFEIAQERAAADPPLDEQPPHY